MKTIPLVLIFTALTVTGCGGSFVPRTTSDDLPVFHSSKPASPTPSKDDDLMYGLLVGEVALQRGQLDSALQVYAKAARESKELDVVERATRIADVALNAELGVEMATLWVERNPKDLEAHQFLANGLMRSGKSDAAMKEFEFLLAALNDNKQSYFRIASQLAHEKNQDAALEVMDKLARKHADDPYALLAYSQLAARYNRLPQALEQVDAALRMKKDWPDALVLRAHILQMQNKTDEALSIYNTALNGTLADNSSVRMAYARLLLDIKRFDEAYAQYGKLVEREPGNSDILYATALLALQTNHYDHAEKLLLQLLKLHERIFEASYYLGQIAEKNNFAEEAMDWYDQVSSGEFYLNARLRTAALMAKQGLVTQSCSIAAR
ncbi:MAG: tetratricopeptide repeat protein [Gammaproteobacteria bacterium]|nr:tetratricopeptide repeat protein [Gammaproteobacteria bacterium]